MTEIERLMELSLRAELSKVELMKCLEVKSEQLYNYINGKTVPTPAVELRITGLANRIDKALKNGYLPLSKYLRS